MPMLHGCAFPGCATLTLSTDCVEHELLVRAVKESERTHAASDGGHEPAAARGLARGNGAQEPAQL
jgi:hypothetical protein